MNIARVNALTNSTEPEFEDSGQVKRHFNRRFTAHHIEGFNLSAAVAGPVLDQPHAVSCSVYLWCFQEKIQGAIINLFM